MSNPKYPTPAQVTSLNKATALPPAEITHLKGSELEITLEPNALALIRIATK